MPCFFLQVALILYPSANLPSFSAVFVISGPSSEPPQVIRGVGRIPRPMLNCSRAHIAWRGPQSADIDRSSSLPILNEYGTAERTVFSRILYAWGYASRPSLASVYRWLGRSFYSVCCMSPVSEWTSARSEHGVAFRQCDSQASRATGSRAQAANDVRLEAGSLIQCK